MKQTTTFNVQMLLPKKGLFCFRAQLIASIFPSVPLIPKPPGTNTPLWGKKEQQLNARYLF